MKFEERLSAFVSEAIKNGADIDSTIKVVGVWEALQEFRHYEFDGGTATDQEYLDFLDGKAI